MAVDLHGVLCFGVILAWGSKITCLPLCHPKLGQLLSSTCEFHQGPPYRQSGSRQTLLLRFVPVRIAQRHPVRWDRSVEQISSAFQIVQWGKRSALSQLSKLTEPARPLEALKHPYSQSKEAKDRHGWHHHGPAESQVSTEKPGVAQCTIPGQPFWMGMIFCTAMKLFLGLS